MFIFIPGGKTLAWRVMEMVNPDLFQEACESICSSSSNLDSPGTTGSWSDWLKTSLVANKVQKSN